MRCPSCGSELRPDAAFCDRCGAAVTAEDKPSRARVAVVMVLAVALFVVVALIGIRGLLGSGGGENAPDGSVTATSGGAGSAQSPASGTGSSGATSTTTPTSAASLPAGATACAESGSHPLGAWSGNSRTSCAFAIAVRDAYVEQAPEGGSASVKAESPVTRKSYTMSCSGNQPTTCKGGDGAVVYLAK